jgi:hypothetical protein
VGREIGINGTMEVTGITRKSHGSMLLQLIANMSRNNSAVDVCSTFSMHHFSDWLWEL